LQKKNPIFGIRSYRIPEDDCHGFLQLGGRKREATKITLTTTLSDGIHIEHLKLKPIPTEESNYCRFAFHKTIPFRGQIVRPRIAILNKTSHLEAFDLRTKKPCIKSLN